MVHVRQLIPPLTLLTPGGHTIHAWDFKHKNNLVIAFLDSGCPSCEAFISTLTGCAADLQEKEAVVLLVFPEEPSLTLKRSLPPGLIAGSDVGNRGVWQFLGESGASAQRPRRGVFITDRYGEISAQWVLTEHQFPGIREILGSLELVEIACEECGVPHWPVED